MSHKYIFFKILKQNEKNAKKIYKAVFTIIFENNKERENLNTCKINCII